MTSLRRKQLCEVRGKKDDRFSLEHMALKSVGDGREGMNVKLSEDFRAGKKRPGSCWQKGSD